MSAKIKGYLEKEKVETYAMLERVIHEKIYRGSNTNKRLKPMQHQEGRHVHEDKEILRQRKG